MDTGELTQADLDLEQIAYYFFVRLEFDATATDPALVVRFCDFPGVRSYTINLPGDEPAIFDAYTQPFTVSEISQAAQGMVFDLTSLSVTNVDRRWTELRRTYGLSQKRITVWVVFFHAGSLRLKAKFDPIYEGQTDGVHLGREADFALLPGRPVFIKLFPARVIDGRLFKWLPPPNMKYEYDDQPFVNQAPGGSFTYVPPPTPDPYVPPPDPRGRLPIDLPGGPRPNPRGIGFR